MTEEQIRAQAILAAAFAARAFSTGQPVSEVRAAFCAMPESSQKRILDEGHAATEAYEAAMWRPIDEAPRDCTTILLYTPQYGGKTVVGHIYPDGQMEKHDLMIFTHFRPLPKPPAQQVKHTHCGASKDGECFASWCPQNADGEPNKSGRSCPLIWPER